MATLRCYTTILFADLSSSTQLGEFLDPEQLAELLACLRQQAENVVSKHGGVVNQFYGDGILAAFGFLEPNENNVLHAINAALELHQSVKNILPLPGISIPNFEMQLHSGIHADLVFVQEGDAIQGRYKLTGDALNTAARLSDAAKADEILVSAPTIRSLLPYFKTEKVPPLQLKGKRHRLEAYKVRQRTKIKTRFEASVQRGLRQFIGRNQEQGHLFTVFNNVTHAGCQYVELCGDPGLGKTRLSEEFLSRINNQATIYKAYCGNSDSRRPLQPFIDIIRSLFHHQLHDECTYSSTVFLPPFRHRFTALAEYEADYLRLLGMTNTQSPQIDGATLAQRSINAITQLFQHLLQQHDRHISNLSAIMTLYLDDWHMADDLSIKLLDHLIETLADDPLFILIAARTPSQELKRFSGKALTLHPLSLVESSQLASGFFSHNGFSQTVVGPFANLLYQQSGGNPLFIEELCQSITDEPDGNQASNNMETVPVTLSGLIATRLRRLPAHLQSLVNIAAVLGNTFECWLFEAMLDDSTLRERIEELAQYDVIYSGGTQGTLRFKHGLTREVAYETIRLQERFSLHIKAVDVLEKQVHKNGSNDYYELLAYHCQQANEPLKTAAYSELAGDRALATMALDRASAQYQRALKMLDPANCTLPKPHDQTNNNKNSLYERWKKVLLKFGWVSVFDPSHSQLATFQRGLVLAQEHQAFEAMAQSQYWLGYLHYALGNATTAINYCNQAIVTATGLRTEPLIVEATALLGQAKGAATEYGDAILLLDRALHAKHQHKKHTRPSIGSAYSLACKGTILGDQGNFDAACACFESALETLRGNDHQLEGSVRGLYAAVNLWQGRWQQGKNNAERAYQIAQRISSSYMSTMYLSLATYAEWRQNGMESSIKHMLSATSNLEDHRKMLFSSLNYGWASDMLVSVGQWQKARRYAARALVRARHHDHMGEAMAYRALALLADAYQSHSYQHYMERAMASAQRRHSHHEEANNHACWATILFRQKQFDSAQRHLHQALDIFQALDMPWHAQRAGQLSQMHSSVAS